MINSTDIAKLAGVSRSTVSKVINNYSDIPEVTRQKVLQIIKAQGYIPNAAARNLKGIKQPVILLCIYLNEVETSENQMCGVKSPYMMNVISNFVFQSAEVNHNLMIKIIAYTDSQEVITAQIRELFQSGSITGAAFIGLTDNCLFAEKLAQQQNIILIDYQPLIEDKSTDSFLTLFTDDHLAAQKMVQHLTEAGHKDIAFAGGDREKMSAQQRKLGFLSAMDKAGLIPSVVLNCSYSEEGGNHCFDQIRDKQATAVVCASDSIAMGIYQRCHQEGILIPDKLSIIGFDNTIYAQKAEPPLTSMEIDMNEMAQLAINSLLNQINPDKLIPVHLVMRESVKVKSEQ